MKRLFVLLISIIVVISLTACQNAGGGAGSDPLDAGESATYADSLEVMSAIWDTMPEDSRFSCFGGNQYAPVSDAPGAFDLSDASGLSYLLLIPESAQGSIDNAASLVHLMNANTFTGAVIHISGSDASDVGASIKDTVLGNQFMCGFPDKLVMLSLGDYVIYAFGSESLIDSFMDAASAALIGTVEVLYDQWIA